MRACPPVPSLRRRLGGPALAVLLALSGAACDSVTGPLDEERDRLEQARAQWRSQGIQDYRYTFRLSCFCASTEPVTVTVRGNAVQSVTRVSDGEQQDPAPFDTIEGLFEELGKAIDSDPASFHADYHPGLGYPASAYIDQDVRIADEERGFTVTDLQPLR